MPQLLAILGSFGFAALGVALLRYTDAPPVIGWATIGFFGLGGIWMIAKQIHNMATHKRQPDFVDVDLPLTELSKNAAGEYHATAQGIVDGRLIGFSVLLRSQWDARPNAGFTLYSGTVVLRAIGDVSDAFVGLLAARYDVPLSMQRMLPEVEARAVGLNSDPREVALRTVSLKLFFHPDSEDRYAEVFLNIDPAQRVVQLREKDLEYRGNVLRALTEAAQSPVLANGQG
jgi:hypothetical protein